jgi:predicted transcriptional regulator
MDGFVEKQTQQKIFELIKRKPGLYISKIAEIMNIPISEVERHLVYMEENEIIVSKIEGGYRRYYCLSWKLNGIDSRVLETRRKIYNVIAKNPGLHQTRIAQMLSMRKSLAEYHLSYLEKNNAIKSITESGYKRYYAEDSDLETEDQIILPFLRQEIPRKILLFLLRNPNSKHKEILENLDIAPSTLSYHLNKLVEREVLTVVRYGEDKGYSISNRRQVLKILISYEIEGVVDSFKDLWEDLY